MRRLPPPAWGSQPTRPDGGVGWPVDVAPRTSISQVKAASRGRRLWTNAVPRWGVGVYAMADASSSSLRASIWSRKATMSSFVFCAFGNISFCSSLTWCFTYSDITFTLAS